MPKLKKTQPINVFDDKVLKLVKEKQSSFSGETIEGNSHLNQAAM